MKNRSKKIKLTRQDSGKAYFIDYGEVVSLYETTDCGTEVRTIDGHVENVREGAVEVINMDYEINGHLYLEERDEPVRETKDHVRPMGVPQFGEGE